MSFLSKYGVARHVYIAIPKAGSANHAVSADWTPAAGDVKISKDGGAAANVTNLPTAIAMGNSTEWDFSLTATEMEAAQIVVTVADSATKAVDDTGFIIETYGHASAQHAFDLDTASTAQTGDAYGVVSSGTHGNAALKTLIDAVDDLLDTEIAAITSSLTTIAGYLDTEIAAILADTNELQTDWVNGGRLDLLIDAIKAKTDNLPSDPADASDITSSLGSISTTLSTIAGYLDTEVAAILADTNELQTDWVNGGRLDLLIDAIKLVLDRVSTMYELDGAVYRYTTNALEQAPAGGGGGGGVAGEGSIEWPITITDGGATPIPGVDVWVTTDNLYDGNVVAGVMVTDAFGVVTFMLDAGDYYCWRQRAGYNFTNPKTFTVS